MKLYFRWIKRYKNQSHYFIDSHISGWGEKKICRIYLLLFTSLCFEYILLQEDRSAGWTVCQLQVTDADLYLNHTDVAFAIISGNNEDYFRMDTEGRIVTTAKLILRLHAVYRLQVRVYDPQQPSLCSDGWITIKVALFILFKSGWINLFCSIFTTQFLDFLF